MAKKKKTKKPRRLRKKHQERKRTRNMVAESRERLLERTKTLPFGADIKVDDGSIAKEKMSDVIIRFADPLL